MLIYIYIYIYILTNLAVNALGREREREREREMSCLYFLWASLYYFNELYVKIKTRMLGEL